MHFKKLKFLFLSIILILGACTSQETQKSLNKATDPVLLPPVISPTTSVSPNLTNPNITPLVTAELQEPSKQALTSTPAPSPKLQTSTDVMRIVQIKMFDSNTGWALYSSPYIRSDNSKILRTTQGLHAWLDVTPSIKDSILAVRAAYFFDENTAVIVSSRSFFPVSPNVELSTWFTENGGETWHAGEILQIDFASDFYPSELDFIDKDTGWLLAESDTSMRNIRMSLLDTLNGGDNWKVIYDTANHLTDVETLWIKGYYPYLDHMTFISKGVGFFSNGRLFNSQDGGKTWNPISLISPMDMPELDCLGGGCAYLDLILSPVFVTENEGFLIRRVYKNSEKTLDALVYYPSTTNRLPLPTDQYIYYTHDGGQTWEPKPSPVNLGTLYFLDLQTGWILGKNDQNPRTNTVLYLTNDGGETWKQISADCVLPLGSQLQFIDNQIGFAVYPLPLVDYYRDFDGRLETISESSGLFYTTDGGHSWDMIEYGVTP